MCVRAVVDLSMSWVARSSEGNTPERHGMNRESEGAKKVEIETLKDKTVIEVSLFPCQISKSYHIDVRSFCSAVVSSQVATSLRSFLTHLTHHACLPSTRSRREDA